MHRVDWEKSQEHVNIDQKMQRKTKAAVSDVFHLTDGRNETRFVTVNTRYLPHYCATT